MLEQQTALLDLTLETSIGMATPLEREECDIMGQVIYVLQSFDSAKQVLGGQTGIFRQVVPMFQELVGMLEGTMYSLVGWGIPEHFFSSPKWLPWWEYSKLKDLLYYRFASLWKKYILATLLEPKIKQQEMTIKPQQGEWKCQPASIPSHAAAASEECPASTEGSQRAERN